MDIRKLGVLITAAVLVMTSCGNDPDDMAEPTQTVTVTAEPKTPATADAEPTAIDPRDWCVEWWEQVVEQSEVDPEKATGAAFLLAQEGIRVDDELISDRAAVLDYNTGPSPTQSEIEQAYDDLALACAVYNATD